MKKTFQPQPTAIAMLFSLILQPVAQASIVRGDVDYQYFRDFAENKGQFVVGASNIEIYDKSNQLIGTMLKDVPMIDFSSVSRNSGIATLIDPQYIASVAHNGSYNSVGFGASSLNPDAHHFDYLLVDRNNYFAHNDGRLNNLKSGKANSRNKEQEIKNLTTEAARAEKDKTKNGYKQRLDRDYHIPRLHKLVTEAVPVAVVNADLEGKTYSKNKERFPVFLRVGSGTQQIRTDKNNTKIRTPVANAYSYLTGGASVSITGNRYQWIDAGSHVFGNDYGPLVTYAMQGDSGSPLFAHDKEEGRWVMIAVLNFNNGDNGRNNTFAINRPKFIEQKKEDAVNIEFNSNEIVVWKKVKPIKAPVILERSAISV